MCNDTLRFCRLLADLFSFFFLFYCGTVRPPAFAVFLEVRSSKPIALFEVLFHFRLSEKHKNHIFFLRHFLTRVSLINRFAGCTGENHNNSLFFPVLFLQNPPCETPRVLLRKSPPFSPQPVSWILPPYTIKANS